MDNTIKITKIDDIIDQIKNNKLVELGSNIHIFINGHLENLKKLCNALESNLSVKMINLYNCNIDNIGTKYISDMLKVNSSIKIMALTTNQIDDLGAKYISDMLKENNSLTKLYLTCNNIGELGAKYISNALKKNTSLTFLSIGNNNLGIVGLKYINEALKKNNTLDTLWMHCVDINVDQFNLIFIDTLKCNSSITDIGHYNNIIESIYERNIHNKYQKNVSLIELVN